MYLHIVFFLLPGNMFQAEERFTGKFCNRLFQVKVIVFQFKKNKR